MGAIFSPLQHAVNQLNWKIGFEIELLAQPGQHRKNLAEHVAAACGGSVLPFFFPDAEPSKVPGLKMFHSLTPGFETLDVEGRSVAFFVDDVTIQHDLNRETPPTTDWYRIVSDDKRILNLVERQCSALEPIERVLQPLAALFGGELELGPNDMRRVSDRDNNTVAMACRLPGERERPCEVVTQPLEHDHFAQLTLLLSTARTAGFVAPAEGAVHLHFDAARLQDAAVLSRLAALLHPRRDLLRWLFATNPRCCRLGPWSDTLLRELRDPAFGIEPWDSARSKLSAAAPTKYCDFNIRNIVDDNKRKLTFEVRILPVHLHAEPIMLAAQLFEAVLLRALEPSPVTWAPNQDACASATEEFFALIHLPQDCAAALLQPTQRHT